MPSRQPGGASGNPVTFSIDPASASACSISANVVTFLGAGTCTVLANQQGDSAYAAGSASQSFTVQDTVGPSAIAIGGFLSDRGNLIVSNLFDMGRQVDRLNAARQEQGGEGGGGNFAERSKGGLSPFMPSAKLGAGPGGVTWLMPALGAKGAEGDSGQRATALQSFLYNYLSAAGESGNPLAFNYEGVMDVQANFGEDSSSASFKASLSQMMKWQDEQGQADMQSLGLGRSLNSSIFMPLDIWMEGDYATYDGERSGRFGMVSVGADYVFNPSFLAGFYGQFDRMDQTSGPDVRGTGWMAGPYASLRLSDNVFWQGRGSWGTSSNTINTAGGRDHFDSTRWLLSSSLTGRWEAGNGVSFEPTGSFTYFEDRSDSYLDSASLLIPGVKTSLGQLKFSPALSYSFTTDDGLWVQPALATELIWNFASTNIEGMGTLDETAQGPKGARGRIKAGLKVRTVSGITFGASGAYDGIGSDGFHSISGNANVDIPLN